jgi:hypothetical protein
MKNFIERVLLITLSIGLVVSASSCSSILGSSPTPLAPPSITEPSIPADFSTYTREDFFSISYPSDWTPAMSFIEEVWEEIKYEIEGTTDADLGDAAMVFLGGLPDPEGYYPTVSVLVTSRTTGYWSLHEIVEIEDQFERDNTPGYQELSRVETTIGGREAIIIDSKDNEPGYGPWRYLQIATVDDEYAWWVTCSCEMGDFEKFESVFYSIVRSFRSYR